jgi:hypothetical protein
VREEKPKAERAGVERISLSRVNDVRLPVEFKKATAAIHIAPKSRITLVQRKAFNVLLANALNAHESLDQTSYSISLPYLMKELNFDSNNTSHIKAALRHLNVLQVQWEAIDNQGREKWGVATMIAEAEIVGNRVFYSFAPRTKKMLLDPEFYGRINLEIQKQFSSQYAFALYENCIRFIDVGKTSIWTVAEWRDLLNALGDYYNEFKNFSRKVLKPAIEEVNEVSDINISAVFVYEGKAVTHLQFAVERKRQSQLILDVPAPRDARLEKKLSEIGFKEADVVDLVNTYEAEYLWSSLSQLEDVVASGAKPIKSKSAYLRTMLKNNKKASSDKAKDKATAEGRAKKAPIENEASTGKHKNKDNPALEELRENFNIHRRNRAQEIYNSLHADEQQTLQLSFEKESDQPTQILSSFKKSGFKSKLVSSAFDTYIQEKLLKDAMDMDMLQFAIAKGLLSSH